MYVVRFVRDNDNKQRKQLLELNNYENGFEMRELHLENKQQSYNIKRKLLIKYRKATKTIVGLHRG